MGGEKREISGRFWQIVEEVRKSEAGKPRVELTEEQGEELGAHLRSALTEAKAKIDGVKAGGGPDARMEAANVLVEALTGVFDKMGLTPEAIDPETGLDRTPTLERNGREVVSDPLDAATLRDGAVELLVERYIGIATAMYYAHEDGRITRYNRLYKRLDAIDKALKARTPDARSALVPLLTDSNPGVRYFAAHDCRDIAPEQARAALERMNRENAGSLGASAQMGLKFSWDAEVGGGGGEHEGHGDSFDRRDPSAPPADR